MKILFLNPHVDAEHQLAKALQKRGVALLLPGDAEEAWQMLQLHGTSVDLAIIHREGAGGEGDSGLEFVSKAKSDPAQADLPIVLSSEKWSESQCAEHQRGPTGANAYLTYPFSELQLIEMVEAVIGAAWPTPLPKPKALEAQIPPGVQPSPATAPDFVDASPSLMLEEASRIYGKEEKSDSSIRLEAPQEAPAPFEQASVVLSAEPPTASGIPVSEAREEVSIPTASTETGIMGAEPVVADAPSMMLTQIGSASSSSGADPFDAPASVPEAESVVGEAGPSFSPSAVLPEPLRPSFAPAAPVAPSPAAASGEEVDQEVAQEMPYLFGGGASGAPKEATPGIAFAQPVGDAVVPGGAAQAPDLETLKKYLLLREQDVAALSVQLRSAREQLAALEDTLRQERATNVELRHTVEEQKRKIEDFERDKQAALEAMQGEINELRFQIKSKTDKARVLEAKVRDATEEMERLKERVRLDIRKIRVREKELENRLEIMKKDSEALISARENKIIELKRKLDLIEFNMDLLQDQYSREKENASRLKERLTRAAQVVRVAGGLLDASGGASQAAAAAPRDGEEPAGEAAS